MSRSNKIRIYDNNHLAAASATIVAADDGSYPFENALNGNRRGLVWNPGTKSLTVTVDFGYNANVTLFSVMGPSNANFGLSPTATVTLKGNMINLFTGSEPFSQVATVYDTGIFMYLDTDTYPEGVQYRYWQIVINDTTNPSSIFVNYIYLGDHVPLTYNIRRGYNLTRVDQSIVERSDSGAIYTQSRPQYIDFSGLSHVLLTAQDRRSLMECYQRVGKFAPFILSLDPLEECLDPVDSHILGYFSNDPQFTQVRVGQFSANYNIVEVV